MLKFPYGVCDFYKLITNHFFYVDRTNHIHLIENAGEQLLFLRPRRFGKSLLLSMLENYYDVAKAYEFDQLFGHLAIGQNPTFAGAGLQPALSRFRAYLKTFRTGLCWVYRQTLFSSVSIHFIFY
jgi:hypothetical protein